MTTLEELRREKERLQNRNLNKQEIKDIEKERKVLKREIKELRNPIFTSFKKRVSRTLIAGGKKTLVASGKASLKFADQLTRPRPKQKKVMLVSKTKPIKQSSLFAGLNGAI